VTEDQLATHAVGQLYVLPGLRRCDRAGAPRKLRTLRMNFAIDPPMPGSCHYCGGVRRDDKGALREYVSRTRGCGAPGHNSSSRQRKSWVAQAERFSPRFQNGTLVECPRTYLRLPRTSVTHKHARRAGFLAILFPLWECKTLACRFGTAPKKDAQVALPFAESMVSAARPFAPPRCRQGTAAVGE
jgi:hypothetical protein